MAVFLLERNEQGEVIQPRGFSITKNVEGPSHEGTFGALNDEAPCGEFEKGGAHLDDPSEIDISFGERGNHDEVLRQ